MRTRRAIYPADQGLNAAKWLLQESSRRLTRRQSLMIDQGEVISRPLEGQRLAKRARLSVSVQVEEAHTHPSGGDGSSFDKLPDDLLVSVFAILSSRADSPKDLINAILT